jgi:exopolyphosphatase/guanosine-5'-triphosphate,3'-diphosphate pyrophosphatase
VPAPHDRYAVIDVGSNSVHLLVAQSDGASVGTIDDVSEALWLGRDVERYGRIRRGKTRRLARTIRAYVARAQGHGVARTRLLATQAMRAAGNRDEVVLALQEAAGLPVEVLDPEHEASFAVAAAALTRTWREPYLVVDVGGASTDCAVAQGEKLLGSRSVPVGSGAVEVLAHGTPPTPAEIAAWQSRVSLAVVPALAALLANYPSPQGAVALGGAARRTARVCDVPGLPARVSLGQIYGALTVLWHDPKACAAPTRRVKRSHLPSTRAGAIILLDVLRAARLAECTISPFGIREGAILDTARAETP